MSRKDYVVIANVIKSLDIDYPTKCIVADRFAEQLKLTNATFIRERFIKACGIN